MARGATSRVLAAGRRRRNAPRRIHGLVLWLRADRGITLSGSDVSDWADEHVSGLTFSQATASKQPAFISASSGLESRPAVYVATGTSEVLTASSGVALGNVDTSDWFFALDPVTAAGNSHLIRGGVGTLGGVIYYRSSAGANTYGIYDGSAHRINNVAPTTSPLWLEWELDAAASAAQCRVDGADSGSSVTYDGTFAIDTADTLYLGNDSGGTGDADCHIAEVAAYGRVLTDVERQRLWAYAQSRYGL